MPSLGEEPGREKRNLTLLLMPNWSKKRMLKQGQRDPIMYMEVDMSNLPSRYTEDSETFRQVLNISDPRFCMPVSSASVMGLKAVGHKQEPRPKGPSTFLTANNPLKEALEKFEQDFKIANLPEGKFCQTSPSFRKVVQMVGSCFEEKMKDLIQILLISASPMGPQ